MGTDQPVFCRLKGAFSWNKLGALNGRGIIMTVVKEMTSQSVVLDVNSGNLQQS